MRLTEATLAYYRCQLKPFLHCCDAGACQHGGDISPVLIRGYLVHLQDRRLSDYSIHAAARAIRAFLNFCVREGWIAVSPMDKVPMPRIDRRILPSFTEAEVVRLLRACQTARDEAIVLCLLDTGCRASELVGLDGADVDLASGEVRVRQGKGRQDRSVFLGERARARLADYYIAHGAPNEHAPVFVSQARGQRLTASGLHQLLKRLGAQAGVAHCAPHSIRRTFAIWCLRNGMDIFRLARLMGHADISVLRQHLYLIKDDLRRAHAQYAIVDRLPEA